MMQKTFTGSVFQRICLVLSLASLELGCMRSNRPMAKISTLQPLPEVLEAIARKSETEPSLYHLPISKNFSFKGPLDRQLTVDRIRRSPDYKSYHLLFCLRTFASGYYESIEKTVVAHVLASALERCADANDFAILMPGSYIEGPAGRALRELGTSSLSDLRRLLHDMRPLPISGSEDATVSVLYEYRVCDFAYHYISLAETGSTVFYPKAIDRDRLIDAYLCGVNTEKKSSY